MPNGVILKSRIDPCVEVKSEESKKIKVTTYRNLSYRDRYVEVNSGKEFSVFMDVTHETFRTAEGVSKNQFR